jgi:hypothetical protein
MPRIGIDVVIGDREARLRRQNARCEGYRRIEQETEAQRKRFGENHELWTEIGRDRDRQRRHGEPVEKDWRRFGETVEKGHRRGRLLNNVEQG